MVSLAEGHARNTAGDQAEIDGLETGEKAGTPWAGIRRGWRRELLSVGHSLVEAVLPVLDITVIDGTTGGFLVRHCD